MGRTCAVIGCNSGKQADIRRREADNVRKASLFQVPKVSLFNIFEWGSSSGRFEKPFFLLHEWIVKHFKNTFQNLRQIFE